MIRQGDNSMKIIARAIGMLKEMPHPYPIVADVLTFFACIDYTQKESVVIDMISNYLLAHIKGGHARNRTFYMDQRPR